MFLKSSLKIRYFEYQIENRLWNWVKKVVDLYGERVKKRSKRKEEEEVDCSRPFTGADWYTKYKYDAVTPCRLAYNLTAAATQPKKRKMIKAPGLWLSSTDNKAGTCSQQLDAYLNRQVTLVTDLLNGNTVYLFDKISLSDCAVIFS